MESRNIRLQEVMGLIEGLVNQIPKWLKSCWKSKV